MAGGMDYGGKIMKPEIDTVLVLNEVGQQVPMKLIKPLYTAEQVAALMKELSDMRANHPENACYDVPTWLKLREQIAALQKYGCELDDWNDKLQNQLAASQAREAKLREAMQYDLEKNDGLACATYAALALPTDDTSLQQRYNDTRMTLLDQQVGALLAGRERMCERIRKLRAYIASNCPHAAADINCPTCEFLKEDAK